MLFEIDLSHNYISEIISLGNCLKLKKLNLSYNEIRNIGIKIFTQHLILEDINLEHNRLT